MAAKRKHDLQPTWHPQRQPESPRVVRRRIEKKPKKSFYTFKMLCMMCGIGIFGLMFVELYMASQINHIHYEIQGLQHQIEGAQVINEQLHAQVSILSQQSRIIEIATEHGLTLTPNENIVNINR
ncbi:MAG: hypothetical protein FWG67_02385 [Defluviitaleaceae bacterium]|nr:hypothetical protein [Defluviitaleaceae bacterium]